MRALVATLALFLNYRAFATPDYLSSFKSTYPKFPAAKSNCLLCHANLKDYGRNSYGADFENNNFDFKAIEGFDSDVDSYINLVEINAGTSPGDSNDHPVPTPEPTPTPTPIPAPVDCLSCHDRQITTKSRKISNIKEKFTKPFSAHSFLQCTDCHLTHDDQKNPNLLVDSFPFGKHAAYIATSKSNTYALCFRCHNVEMMNRKISGDETKFYTVYWPFKKRTNAHYSHVVRPKINDRADSAYSCAACHDVHGTDQAHNIRPDTIAGHTKQKYKISKNGGSCAGSCHQNAKYQR